MGKRADKIVVIYHAGCWDGFCAAWVAGIALGRWQCEFHAASYGDTPPDVKGKDVYVLDFCYSLGAMQQLQDDSRHLHVYDHHKTAKATLDALDGATVVFDVEKSGGRITWEQLGPDGRVPWLVCYTEDRDLWRHALPESRAVNAALRSYPLDHRVWDELESAPETTFVAPGLAILREQQNTISTHVRHATEHTIDGHAVLGVNATVYQSEIAGQLAKNRPFGFVWFDAENGTIVSLRSTPDGVDVSDIATRHGGGGHPHAAGFTLDEGDTWLRYRAATGGPF